MLILLPPSEGKAAPRRGKPLDLAVLSSPELTTARTTLLSALVDLCRDDPVKAAEELAGAGIEAEVIDLRTLKPMDSDAVVASVQKTGRAVTVEEGWQQSGVGAEIAARIMERALDYLDAPVARVSGKDVPMPYAANLEKLALPNVAEVVEAVKAVTYTA